MLHQNKIQQIIRATTPILKKNSVVKAGIFGSYARGEERKKSDLDLLVKINGKKSLLDIVKLQFELERNLKMPVDILEYGEIHPTLKKRILSEEVRIV